MKAKLAIDFRIQVALIAIGLIVVCFNAEFDTYIYFYLAVGLYQVISHYIKYYKIGWQGIRRFYNYCLWAVYAGFLISAIIIKADIDANFPIIYAFAMLFGSPVLAIICAVASYVEMKNADLSEEITISDN